MRATLIVIQNDVDHAAAKALVEKLVTSVSPSDHAKLRAQARLIEEYERKLWPRKTPAVQELLKYLMDQHGLTRSDLVPLLGSPSRVSEILRGKRTLSISMVKRLRERFGVSADLLIPRERERGGLAA